MHSRILQISKNPHEALEPDYNIPDFFFDYADYVVSQPRERFQQDFEWFVDYAKGTNYIKNKSILVFNPETLMKECIQDEFGFYVYVPSGEEYFGLEPEDCLMTVHEFAERIFYKLDDDGIWYAIGSMDYHF